MPDLADNRQVLSRGIPASSGVCQGRILVLRETVEGINRRELLEAEVSQEIERLEKALIQTRFQIQEVQHKVNAAMGGEEASIFEAHLLILEDQTVIEEVIKQIRDGRKNVEWAFNEVTEKYIESLSAIDDEYLRERSKDLKDVANRVLGVLTGRSQKNPLNQLQNPCIVVAEDLTPSVTALLDKKMVLGFATDAGSKTSHTAILARSLGIPAVVGLKDISKRLRNGQYVLLDGFNGCLILNPTDQSLFEYGQLVKKQVHLHEKLADLTLKPATTLDGKNIILSANIEQPSNAAAVIEAGNEGVGLFRTEYLYLNRTALPTEEEQYQAYREVAVALKPHPVILRTLDLGGDKFISHLPLPREMNPFLGWRAIRFCLQETDIFRTQLRAILRASTEGNIKMMYPMISGLEELNQANELLEECKADLAQKGIPFDPSIECGIMIEIPSAVLVADSLAKRVKFFSLGTNDLIQYTLAVDRLNERIAHLYEPTHPAILRSIRMTIEAAHRHQIWVGICGEMASDLILVPILIGLGIDELSVGPSQTPQVKYLIRRMKLSEAKELAEWALTIESANEILERSRAFVHSIAPCLFESQNQSNS